ncbi:carbohydrate ABC transporter permease [Burkholderia sp. Nafp2/4-1b]|uniref:carbohydrate ABC transporter permease n=1 Tax=Burkholderia sp. Nafp2/4-1b TaxID=2116686 RepID=UPI000EF87507|nr:carbohydrate ABC transporter permease [Burkholderia sp. Nafp2/4-1b]RKU00067.1 carbohydrate ABC transporter permease [Burkholderia sp. Nafp2/4-1b]
MNIATMPGVTGYSVRRTVSFLRNAPVFLRSILAVAITGVVLLPILYMLAMSVRSGSEIALNPLGLPSTIHWSNYTRTFAEMNYWRSVANTIGITVVVTLLVSVIGSMAAYPLARLRTRMSSALYILLTLGLTIPMFVSLTPIYLLLRDFGLLNTYAGIILAYTVLNLPLGVFFYCSFLKSIPPELEEAAVLDGCSAWQVYWYVILPLLRPITGTLAMFVTLHVWNDLVYPLLFLSDESKFPITVSVFRFIGTQDVDPTKLFPAAVLGTLPLLVMFLVLQRQIVAGISAGAVKG